MNYDTYSIIRFFNDNRKSKVIYRNLSIQQAKEHCNNSNTHGSDWFDGYSKE